MNPFDRQIYNDRMQNQALIESRMQEWKALETYLHEHRYREIEALPEVFYDERGHYFFFFRHVDCADSYVFVNSQYLDDSALVEIIDAFNPGCLTVLGAALHLSKPLGTRFEEVREKYSPVLHEKALQAIGYK
jgi:hypothetical protein